MYPNFCVMFHYNTIIICLYASLFKNLIPLINANEAYKLYDNKNICYCFALKSYRTLSCNKARAYDNKNISYCLGLSKTH